MPNPPISPPNQLNLELVAALNQIAEHLADIASSISDVSDAIGPADGNSTASIVDQLQIHNDIQNLK